MSAAQCGQSEKQLFRLLLVALLVARLAFVAVYLEHYARNPGRRWISVTVALSPGLACWLRWLLRLVSQRTPAIRTSFGQRIGRRRVPSGLGQPDVVWA